MARTPLPREVVDEIVRLYREGLGPKAIAPRVGVCVRTVSNYLNLRRVPRTMPIGGSTRSETSLECEREALRLYAETDLSYTGIADRVGVGSSTIGRWVRSAGIPRSKRTARRSRAPIDAPRCDTCGILLAEAEISPLPGRCADCYESVDALPRAATE